MSQSDILVHFNGWSQNRDEWIRKSSQRIAPFRTHTLQSMYASFMSPYPTRALDPEPQYMANDVVPYPDELLETVCSQLESVQTKINKLLDVKRQREEQLKMIELFKKKNKEKGERISYRAKTNTLQNSLGMQPVKPTASSKSKIAGLTEIYSRRALLETRTRRTFSVKHTLTSLRRCKNESTSDRGIEMTAAP